MLFTEKEAEYLRKQVFGRLATVGRDGQPHNVPVGFSHNTETNTIDIVGRDMPNTQKYRNIQRHSKVALVIDSVEGENHEVVQAIEIRGVATALPHGGKAIRAHCADEIIRITPTRITAWGIDADIRAGVNNRAVPPPSVSAVPEVSAVPAGQSGNGADTRGASDT